MPYNKKAIFKNLATGTTFKFAGCPKTIFTKTKEREVEFLGGVYGNKITACRFAGSEKVKIQ